MNRLTTAAVLVGALLLAVAGGLIVAVGHGPSANSTGGGTPSSIASASTVPATSTPVPAVASRDLAYDPSVNRAPTAQPPQSKLWFADGRWWGILAAEGGRFSIHWLDWSTQVWHDTGTLVDERPAARADALWAAGKLYVASGGSRPAARADAIRVLRFSFDQRTSHYTLDDGFPITVTPGGADSLTIARDGSDRLWLAYLGADGLALSSTDGDDHRWSSAFRPPAPAGSLPAETAALVAQPDRVVLVWTAANDDALFSSVHPVRAAPTANWVTTRTAVEGLRLGPDQLDVKASARAGGAVYAALRTSLSDREGANARDPQVLLLALRADGTWDQHVVSLIADHATWPVVVLNEEARMVTVMSVAPGAGGRVYAKSATTDSLSFGAGIGEPFVTSDQDSQINRPTSTKQAVSSSTGLVVLAADDHTGYYVHGAAGLGGVPPGKPRPNEGAAPSANGQAVLFSSSFDAFPAGASLPLDWQLSDPDSGQLTIAAIPSATDRSARLAAASAEVAASVCHDLPAYADGTLQVTATVMVFGGPATDDAKLIVLRGRGIELASIRINPDGTFAYFNAANKTTVPNPFERSRWYRLSIRLDLAKHTYDAELADVATGGRVFSTTAQAWRATDREPDKVCFSTATGPSSGILFDDVRAVR